MSFLALDCRHVSPAGPTRVPELRGGRCSARLPLSPYRAAADPYPEVYNVPMI